MTAHMGPITQPLEEAWPDNPEPVNVVASYQASCDLCGWHTQFATPKRWVVQMADAHRKVCPNREASQ